MAADLPRADEAIGNFTNADNRAPEAPIAGREDIWLRFILQSWTYNPEALTQQDLDAYARAYRMPGAVRGH
jgi:hypothetical protein